LTPGPNVPIPGTKYKRSNRILFVKSIALICGRVWAQLLQPLAQSLIGSPVPSSGVDTLENGARFVKNKETSRGKELGSRAFWQKELYSNRALFHEKSEADAPILRGSANTLESGVFFFESRGKKRNWRGCELESRACLYKTSYRVAKTRRIP